MLETAPFARIPRPDVVWSSASETLAPYLWAQLPGMTRPLIMDLDWTFEQQEAMARAYFGRAPRSGHGAAVLGLRERVLWRTVTIFTPWSNWCAESLRRNGVVGDRIRVIPPGVDIDFWRVDGRSGPRQDRPLRLLFVGGDFRRKGGETLMEVVHELGDLCELDVVTREPVQPRPGVRVHRAEPNSERLRDLYEGADLFVLPTTAETFGIATIEAMASGLPVIVSDIGGARDIVDEGLTGWLIAPERQALHAALLRALERRDSLRGMGERAAQVAAERFDGRRNDMRVVDLILELHAKRIAARRRA